MPGDGTQWQGCHVSSAGFLPDLYLARSKQADKPNLGDMMLKDWAFLLRNVDSARLKRTRLQIKGWKDKTIENSEWSWIASWSTKNLLQRTLLEQLLKLEYGLFNNGIVLVLNFLTARMVPGLSRPMLKCLGKKGHDICNLLSEVMQITIYRERLKEIKQMWQNVDNSCFWMHSLPHFLKVWKFSK